jgi:hypothetical protein
MPHKSAQIADGLIGDFVLELFARSDGFEAGKPIAEIGQSPVKSTWTTFSI